MRMRCAPFVEIPALAGEDLPSITLTTTRKPARLSLIVDVREIQTTLTPKKNVCACACDRQKLPGMHWCMRIHLHRMTLPRRIQVCQSCDGKSGAQKYSLPFNIHTVKECTQFSTNFLRFYCLIIIAGDDVRPIRAARCNQPKEVGECKAIMPRFYYDQREGRCKLFTYGGCNGNDNRFLTPWACLDYCGGGNPVYAEEPELPPAPILVKDQVVERTCGVNLS